MINEQEIYNFVERHHTTTFDQWVDYPSPIYHVIYEGNNYCSGIGGDFKSLTQTIFNDQLLKLEFWFPERLAEVWV